MVFSLKLSAARIVFSGCIALTGMMSTSALAADAVVQEQPVRFDERRWKVIVTPYVWAASLTGNAEVAGRTTDVDMPFKEIFENLDLSAMGNIEVTNGLYGAYFDGQYTKTSQTADIYTRRLGANITSTSLAAGVFFRAIELPLEGENIFGNQRVFAVEPTIGVRWTQLKADFELERWSVSRKMQWTDPFIGARINTDLTDRWNFTAEADIGGFGAGTDLSAQGQAYIGYRSFILNQPALLRVGYRALYQDYNGGDILGQTFRWNVTQHGPVAGVSFVF